MSEFIGRPCTAFQGMALLFQGPLLEVALAAKAAGQTGNRDTILIFDDASGRVVDVDLRGTDDEIADRLAARHSPEERRTAPATAVSEPEKPAQKRPARRGRPRLGVVAREITLLPRHWDWLADQPGGASVTLRRLVDEARKADAGRSQDRGRQERAYRFMSALAGDLPGFEEATRALFAGDRAGLARRIGEWPEAIRDYTLKLASE